MFFAAYVIRRKNNSINTVTFLFFFQSQIADFFFKSNDSSGVRTTNVWNGGTGFESLPCQTILRSHWHLLDFPFQRFPWHFVAQHDHEVVGPGLSLSCQYFCDFPVICQKIPWFPWYSVSATRILMRSARFQISAFTFVFKFFFTTETIIPPPPSYARKVSLPEFSSNT